MIFLEKAIVKKNMYPETKLFRKNRKFTFSDINLLVGDQGCGKSTFLAMLQSHKEYLDITLSDEARGKGVNFFFFDSEKHSPRVRDPQEYTDIHGNDVGIGYRGSLLSRWRSHGEVLSDMVVEPLFEAKDCVIMLDEPESGLSITNQFRLIEAINTAVKNGCQLFIATHCYPLIEANKVISLEHKKVMKGKTFIEKVRGK
jgi:predicted ATPase